MHRLLVCIGCLLQFMSCTGLRSQPGVPHQGEQISRVLTYRIILGRKGERLPVSPEQVPDAKELSYQLAQSLGLPQRSDYRLPISTSVFDNPYNRTQPGQFLETLLSGPYLLAGKDTVRIDDQSWLGCQTWKYPVKFLVHVSPASARVEEIRIYSGPAYLDPIEYPLVQDIYREPSLSKALFYRYFTLGLERPALTVLTDPNEDWKGIVSELAGIPQDDLLGIYSTGAQSAGVGNNLLLFVYDSSGSIQSELVYFSRKFDNGELAYLELNSIQAILNLWGLPTFCTKTRQLSSEQTKTVLTSVLQRFVF